MNQWDVAFYAHPSGSLTLRLPIAVGRALAEKGLYRATLTVTNKGLLFVPYEADVATRKPRESVELPDWSTR